MSLKGQIKRLPTKPTSVSSITKKPFVRMQHVADSKLKPKNSTSKQMDPQMQQHYNALSSNNPIVRTRAAIMIDDEGRNTPYKIEGDSKEYKGLWEDPDPNVRRETANFGSNDILHKMKGDEDFRVTRAVASRIDNKGLHDMLDAGPDDGTRREIIGRIDQAGLDKVIDGLNKGDSLDSIDRKTLASRANADNLVSLADDSDLEVRMIVAERTTDQNTLLNMLHDPIGRVVDRAAGRLPLEILQERIPNDVVTKKKEANKSLLEGIGDLKTEGEMVDHFKKNLPDAKYLDLRDPDLDVVFDQETPGFLSYREEWLNSANSDGASVLQQVVTDMFGGQIQHNKDRSPSSIKQRVDNLPPDTIANIKKGLIMSKALTRAILDKKFPNTDSIEMLRGTTMEEVIKKGSTIYAKSNPLSSWTPNEYTANRFGNMTLKAKFHKDEILTTNTFWSHGGNEGEHLVVSPGLRKVKISNDNSVRIAMEEKQIAAEELAASNAFDNFYN